MTLPTDRLGGLGRFIPEVVLLGLAFGIRLAHVLSSSFPLGDGGLFLNMVQRLQADHFVLPDNVLYNGVTIPFTYPPLGFYATGVAADWTGATLLSVMRFLPFALSCVTVMVVWGLARSLLPSRGAVLAAVFAFGTLPLAYRYFVMAAGITRSPGLLFAVATVWAAYLLCARQRAVFLLPLGLSAGLSLLSHPNAAWFAAYSTGLVFLFYCRDWRTLARGVLATVMALSLAAPWLVVSLSRHGIGPFLASSQGSNPGTRAWELLLNLQITQEPMAPVLAVVAVIGVLVCIGNRRWWLPTWLLAACILDSRYQGTFAVVPIALLVGEAAGALGRLLSAGPLSLRLTTRSRTMVYATVGCIALIPVAGSLRPSPVLSALPESDRTAMRWAAEATPDQAAFLVIAPAGISAGSESEWFPVLAERRSLGTYQGLEWLPQPPGPSPWQRYDSLQSCAIRDVACLDRWAQEGNADFDYVFVREVGTERLRESLSASTEFTLSYHAADVWIFARNALGGAQ